jgi:hypothetical protein
VGIVVGTAALNGPVLDGLRDRNAGLISDKRALEGDVRGLQSDVETADDLVRTLSTDLVGGRLSGQRVLLVTAPGTEGRQAEQLTTVIEAAGGSVTGRLALQPALLDPGATQLLEDLVATVLPAGVQLPTGSAVGRAGAVLSSALLTRQGGSAVDRESAQQVVSAFAEAGLTELADAAETPAAATLAVLLTGPAPSEALDDEGKAALEALLDVAEQMQSRSNGLVVAGPSTSADEGGLVRALRADSGRDNVISSVDNVDRAVGQVAVVLALREQAQGGAGRYGGGQGASAPVPTGSPDPESSQPEPEPEPEPQPEG